MPKVREIFNQRLPARIALSVFLSILLIETVMLGFSYLRYEAALMRGLVERGELISEMLLHSGPEALAGAGTAHAHLFGDPELRGMELVRTDGSDPLILGETPPGMAVAAVADPARFVDAPRHRLEVAQAFAEPHPATVRVVFDTSHVEAELFSYLSRSIGLIVLMALLVALVTVAVVHPLVLRPLLRLGRALGSVRALKPLGVTPTEASPDIERRDEFGDLFRQVEALRDDVVSRRFIDQILDCMPDLVLVLDRDGVIIEANDAAHDALGLAAEDLIGLTFTSLSFDGTLAARLRPRERDRRGHVIEAELKNAGGEAVPVEISVGRCDDADAGQGELVCVVRDITMQRTAGQMLKTSEERLRDFAAIASQGFWETDASLRFTYVSERFEEAAGASGGTLLGRSFVESVAPLVRDDDWERQFALLEGRRPFNGFVHQVLKPCGERAALSLCGSPTFDTHGRFLGYRGTGGGVDEMPAVGDRTAVPADAGAAHDQSLHALYVGAATAANGASASAPAAAPGDVVSGAAIAHPLQGLAVLVAEDHPVNQEITRRMLRPMGCDVTLAENGREALEHANSRHFDVVLMDWQMPELDGLATTAEIRRGVCEPTTSAAVPIVAVTANTTTEDRQRCAAAGMNAYLGKPFTRDELDQVLHDVLAGAGAPVPAPQIAADCADEARSQAAAAPADDGAGPVAGNAIDETIIAQVVALDAGAEGLLGRLVSAFESSAREDVSALAAAAREGCAEALRRSAHRLKSSSGNVGALRLASLCASVEAAARGGEIEGCVGAVQAIADELERASLELGQRVEAA